MTTQARVYLDWNATAPMREEARCAMIEASLLSGNPSSVHAEGRAASALLRQARIDVAALVGAGPDRVVFTGSGTEANVTALTPGLGLGDAQATTRLLVGATEHPCVLHGHRFAPDRVETIPVLASGVIDLAQLEGRLARHAATGAGRALVSVHWANNETGVIQPIAEIGLMCRQHDALLHVDAVQAVGRVVIDLSTVAVDALTLSAHKIGGPKGVGALVLGSARVTLTDRLLRGGGQERGVRAGTENLPGIAGFAAAARAAKAECLAQAARQSALRGQLEAGLRDCAPRIRIFGAEADRLANTSCFAVAGLKAETAVILMDMAGVSVSSGSACSSGKVQRSHVLTAMGVHGDLAACGLRVSLGRTTTHDDIEQFRSAFASALATIPGRRDQAAA